MIDSKNERAREVFAAVDTFHAATGGKTVLDRFSEAVSSIRGSGPTSSVQCRQWEGVVIDAVAALDELVAAARPALEHARELVRELGDDLEAEELAAAEAAAEAWRQEQHEAEVARRVSGAEAERLRAIEDDVRAQLATTTGGK